MTPKKSNVEIYMRKRISSWLREMDFPPTQCNEMHRLMIPAIAPKKTAAPFYSSNGFLD